MTIGKEGDLDAFKKLHEYKTLLTSKYGIKDNEFELSMGMSGDYQKAVLNHKIS